MGRRPHFDLEKICEFITYSDKTKIKETEISSTVDKSQEEISDERIYETVKEVITSANQQIDTMRYDLLKILLLTVIESNVDSTNEDSKFTIGEQLAINTLVKNKMLKL